MVPAGASPSTPSSTCTCTTLPSAFSPANTARPLPSGDLPSSAVASAPVDIAPGTSWGVRLVNAPVKTPPATLLGAPSSGRPSGSITVWMPAPFGPNGALVSHGRPNALLMEIAVGRATGTYSAVTAPGL